MSVSTDGAQGDAASSLPETSAVSSDGGLVLFTTLATTLGGPPGIYIRNTVANITHFLATNGADGFQGNPVLSADGSTAVFNSADCGGLCFMRLGTNGAPATAAQAFLDSDGSPFYSTSPVGVSGDGQRVVFHSPEGINLSSGGTEGDIIYSRPGSNTYATVHRFVDTDGDPGHRDDCIINDPPSVSFDGRYVAFLGPDELGKFRICGPEAVWVKDIQTNSIVKGTIVGEEGEPNREPLSFHLSGDGRSLAFVTYYFLDQNVFVRDLDQNETTLAGVDGSGAALEGDSRFPSLNTAGTLVAFVNLNIDPDIYVRDLSNGTTARLTRNGSSRSPNITPDGTKVAFTSAGSNLVAGDTNEVGDVFLMDLSGKLVINSDADRADKNPGNGLCDTGGSIGGETECTLRAAIQEANANSDRTEITFDITGDRTIEVLEELPAVRKPAVIDGTTQPLFERHPLIQVVGPDLLCRSSGIDGLRIWAGNSVVRGLTIGGFPCIGIEVGNLGDEDSGIVVEGNYIGTDEDDSCSRGNPGPLCRLSNGIGIVVRGSHNVIGGSSDEARNVISNNQGGVDVFGSRNTVAGNYIGTDVDGETAHSNSYGVQLNGRRNLLGGSRPALDLCSAPCNVIAGAHHNGVNIDDFGRANEVAGNFIGVSADGQTALPNYRGIDLDAANKGHLIGGPVQGAGNVISGNREEGIYASRGAQDIRIEGNTIGATPGRGAPLPNKNGIYFYGAAQGTIGGAASPTDETCEQACNFIAHNRRSGITVHGSNLARATILGNVVMENGSELGPRAPFGGGISVTGKGRAMIGNGETGTGNVISGNVGNGILLSGGGNARISGNSIHSNDLLGIEDLPPGPNPQLGLPTSQFVVRLNPPVLYETTELNQTARVKGFLQGSRDQSYVIEVFANASCDVSGTGEGEFPVGAMTVTTNARGKASFDLTGALSSLPSASFTATATWMSETSSLSITSEFSQCFPGAAVTQLDTPAAAGSTTLETSETDGFEIGDRIEINPGGASSESATVAGKGSLILDEPLQFDHAAGELIVKASDPPSPAIATTQDVSVRAKRKIRVSGWMAPPYPGASIALILERRSRGEWNRVARKTSVLQEASVLDDGSVVSRFMKGFQRPRGRTCRIRAIWKGNSSYARSAATSETFRCGSG